MKMLVDTRKRRTNERSITVWIFTFKHILKLMFWTLYFLHDAFWLFFFTLLHFDYHYCIILCLFFTQLFNSVHEPRQTKGREFIITKNHFTNITIFHPIPFYIYLYFIPKKRTHTLMQPLSLTEKLLRLYVVTTVILFCTTTYQKAQHTDNYFAAVLAFMDDPLTEFILYNMILTSVIVLFKTSVAIFYLQIKENQVLKIVDKLWYKIFDLILLLYITRASFGILMFTIVVIVFLSFILHNLAIFRSNFLIHTVSFGEMGLHYRVLAHFLILIFIDYQVITHTFFWFFKDGEDEAVEVLFVYYTTSIAMSIIQPFVCFFIHFYERYTEVPISNSDEWEAFLSVFINVPRLLIQILMALIITSRFGFTFFLFLTIIELSVELSRTIKSYMKIQKLTQTMKNLKQLNQQEVSKLHDTTCMICFRDMTEAVILPCHHAFHMDCLRQWIIKNSNHFCPKCKKSFDFDNPKKLRPREENIVMMENHLETRRKAEEKKNEKYDPLQVQSSQLQNSTKRQTGMRQQNRGKPMIEIDSVGKNHLATNLRTKKTQKIPQKQKQYRNVGSVPYGLPMEAIYNRTHRSMSNRRELININTKMIKLMSLQPAKQLLFVPQPKRVE